MPMVLVFTVLFPSAMKGQEAMLSIDSVSPCSGAIFVPVKVKNAIDVSAISLSIKYDTITMQFVDTSNTSSLLQQGITLINAVPGEIYFSWVSMQGTSLMDNTLFELLFEASPGEYAIAWDTMPGQCELANVQNEIIPSILKNGSLHYGPAKVQLLSPLNQSIEQETFIDCNWESPVCASEYQIQLAKDSLFHDIQSDVQTEQSAYDFHDLLFNTSYYWRVRAIHNTLQGAWSDVYSFSTTSGVSIPLEKSSKDIIISSGFSNNMFYYSHEMGKVGDVEVVVYNAVGQPALNASFQNRSAFSYQKNVNLPNGLYFMETIITTNNMQIRKVIKLFKNNL